MYSIPRCRVYLATRRHTSIMGNGCQQRCTVLRDDDPIQNHDKNNTRDHYTQSRYGCPKYISGNHDLKQSSHRDPNYNARDATTNHHCKLVHKLVSSVLDRRVRAHLLYRQPLAPQLRQQREPHVDNRASERHMGHRNLQQVRHREHAR